MSFTLFQKFYDHHGPEGLDKLQLRLNHPVDGRRLTLSLLAQEFSDTQFQLSVASLSRLRETTFEPLWVLREGIVDYLSFQTSFSKAQLEEIKKLVERQDRYRSKLVLIPGGKIPSCIPPK